MNTPTRPFVKRFWTYQNERFPFLGQIPLIGVFSFSALSFSRIGRGEGGFIDGLLFALCVLNTVTVFFLVRIFDEFKDREEDALYRPYLPVPRGEIALSELFWVGVVAFTITAVVDLVVDWKIFVCFAVVMAYLGLMGKEFFVSRWLKEHQFWYVVSHMLIIPLVDTLASSFDWARAGVFPPEALWFFFAVSFFNGIVLEIGRKIRTPETEEPGVLSYTVQLGTKRAVVLWIVLLDVTLGWAVAASFGIGFPIGTLAALGIGFVVCLIPAVWFLIRVSIAASKMIEYASIVWTFVLYLGLGGIPMLIRIFS